jgi:hypothetical protein
VISIDNKLTKEYIQHNQVNNMSPERLGKKDKENFIDPQKIPVLMRQLSSIKEPEKRRGNKKILYLHDHPELAEMIWSSFYPARDLKEQPFLHQFPHSLELGEWEDAKQTLGVGFSNSLPVEITWDYNIKGVCAIEKDWLDPSGQNWVQYDHFQGAALLSEDPWVAKVDHRVLKSMDGLAFKDPNLPVNMRGNFIVLSHYPGKNRVIQILYHFDIHGESESVRYLALRVLGERAKVLNEKHNHYLLYDGQVEEIFVPNMGRFQFVANMPIPRLLRNIFFPENFRRRDAENPLNESLVEGQHPNFWEVSYMGER